MAREGCVIPRHVVVEHPEKARRQNRSAAVPPLPMTIQWMAAAALLLTGGGGAILLLFRAELPLGLLAYPLALSILQFSVTPFLRLCGFYRYHSPMLKATLRSSRTYELHGGTSFDYVWLFRWSERGPAAARRILVYYLEGLLDLARLAQRGALPPGVEVTGTSYFFGERSVRRLGFRLEPPGLRLQLVLLVYYLDLFILYSFSRGRLAFPNVLKVKRASIRAGDLAARSGDILRLIERIAGERPATVS